MTIIGAVSPQGGDFSEPVTHEYQAFCSLLLGTGQEPWPTPDISRLFHWLTSYSEYINDLAFLVHGKCG